MFAVSLAVIAGACSSPGAGSAPGSSSVAASSETSESTPAQMPSDATASGDPWTAYGPGWTKLPPPPQVREGATLGSTGDQLLYWGGTPPGKESARTDGFAFDLSTGRWSSMPDAPGPGLYETTAIPLGSAGVLFLGQGKHKGFYGDLFDPTSRTWTRIARPPLPPEAGEVEVWTGRELIVWGGGSRQSPVSAGAAYDPTTDRWQRIAASPISLNLASGVWTGTQMIVFGSLLNGGNHAATGHSVGAAYDPSRNTWRTIAPSHLSPQATSAVWIAGRMLAWDYEVNSQEFTPSANHWSAPVRMPLSPSECYPDSAVVNGIVFAWYCGTAAEFRPSSGRWSKVRGGMLAATVKANDATYKLYRFADLAPAGPLLAFAAEGITVNSHGTPCYGCPGSPMSFWVYRPAIKP